MTDKELMQQAMEALELLAKYENPLTKIQVRKPRDGGPIVTIYLHQVATDAAELLRERLARPAQQPLTDEQIALISVECAATHRHDDFDFARAIEAAHGIGEKK